VGDLRLERCLLYESLTFNRCQRVRPSSPFDPRPRLRDEEGWGLFVEEFSLQCAITPYLAHVILGLIENQMNYSKRMTASSWRGYAERLNLTPEFEQLEKNSGATATSAA
jgi:hypothetical protein